LVYQLKERTYTEDVTEYCAEVFGPEKEEVAVSILCFIPNIIRLIQSLRKRWTGHVAHMGEKRTEDSVMVGKTDRDHLEDQSVDGRIM